jgi:outer membrane protein TolC
MKIISLCLLVAVILSSLAIHARAGETALGFAEAWQILLEGNDTLAAAQANLDQAKHKKDAAKDLYLPEVDVSASYMRLDDDVTLSPNDILESMPAGNRLAPLLEGLGRGYGLSGSALNEAFTSTIAERNNRSASIRGSWPIYAGGRIDAAQDIARGQEKEAGKKLDISRQEQFEHIARYYFGAVLARQVFMSKGELEEGLKKHLDHALLLEQQGQIAKVERIQAEAACDKAKVERRKAGRDLEIAEIALTRMLKSSEPVTPSDALFIKDTLPPLGTFLEETLADSPGLTILKAKQDQAAGLVAVEEGKYYPTIALFGNYSLYEEDDLASKMLPDWVVGIGLKLPILERSGRSGNIGAAKSAIRQLEHLQSQTRNDLAVLVEKTYRQAEQAIEEYQGLASSLKLAEETVGLRSKSFRQGLSTSLDVVDAEMFLTGVKIQRAAAIYSYVVALAKLLAVSGRMETFFTYQLPQAK